MIRPILILLVLCAFALVPGYCTSSPDQASNDSGSLEDRATPPSLLRGTIVFGYDNKFKRRFGTGSVSKIHEVFNKAHDFLYTRAGRDLGTKFEFRIRKDSVRAHHNVDIQNVGQLTKWQAIVGTWQDTNDIRKIADIYVLMTTNTWNSWPYGKGGSHGGICDSLKTKRAIVSAYAVNDDLSAKVLAQEIGHMLGMGYDFKLIPFQNNEARNGRFLNGRTCTKIGGYMDEIYTSTNKWSHCSKHDFGISYNGIKGSMGGYCLERACTNSQPHLCTNDNFWMQCRTYVNMPCEKACDFCWW